MEPASLSFAAVREAFEANFDEGLEVGAAAAVTVDGEFVVDIWAGDADTDGTPWQRDTIVNVYSTTKTMAATCMLMLADRDELDFDAPVARYWPEFAQNGKDGVLVRHVMAHTAGAARLRSGHHHRAALRPRRRGRKPRSPGTVVGARHRLGLPRNHPGQPSRASSCTASPVVACPTGSARRWPSRSDADFWMSLPASEDHRVAALVPPVFSGDKLTINGVEVSLPTQSRSGPFWRAALMTATEPATREWRAAEIPAAGGFGNARSIARIHAGAGLRRRSQRDPADVRGRRPPGARGTDRRRRPRADGAACATGSASGCR